MYVFLRNKKIIYLDINLSSYKFDKQVPESRSCILHESSYRQSLFSVCGVSGGVGDKKEIYCSLVI